MCIATRFDLYNPVTRWEKKGKRGETASTVEIKRKKVEGSHCSEEFDTTLEGDFSVRTFQFHQTMSRNKTSTIIYKSVCVGTVWKTRQPPIRPW